METPEMSSRTVSFHFGEEHSLGNVNGGYVAASALDASQELAQRRHVLCITTDFLASTKAGACALQCRSLVAGAHATMYEVEHVQGERTVALSRVWFGERGDGPALHDEPMPLVPDPEELRDIESVMLPHEAALPKFWDRFQQRPFNRVAPKSRLSPPAKVLRWFRQRGPSNHAQASFVLPIVDVMGVPGAAMRLESPVLGPRGGVTTQLSVHFHHWDQDVDWVLAEAHCPSAANGRLATSVKIWDRSGRFLAHGISQVVVKQVR